MSKVWAKEVNADMEAVVSQALTKRTDHTTRIAQIEVDLAKLKEN